MICALPTTPPSGRRWRAAPLSSPSMSSTRRRLGNGGPAAPVAGGCITAWRPWPRIWSDGAAGWSFAAVTAWRSSPPWPVTARPGPSIATAAMSRHRRPWRCTCGANLATGWRYGVFGAACSRSPSSFVPGRGSPSGSSPPSGRPACASRSRRPRCPPRRVWCHLHPRSPGWIWIASG